MLAAAGAATTPLGFDRQHLRRDPGLIVYSGAGGAFLAARQRFSKRASASALDPVE